MSADIDRYGRARTPRNIVPQMPVYHTTTYSTPNRSSSSAWDRFNGFFAGIGEWLQDRYENIEEFFFEKIIPVVVVILGIGVVIGAIVTWVSEGFWSFVLYVVVAMVLGGIVFALLEVVLGIVYFVLRILLFLLRLVFTNAVTFFITLAITVGLVVGVPMLSDAQSHRKTAATQSAQTTTTYVCTANSLNVRSYASVSAPVIGKLKKGQRVEVYQTTNNFAKINYSGKTGYVSLKYITPVNQYKPSSSATSNKKAAQTTSQTKTQTQTVKPIPADARNLHAGRMTKKPRIDKTDGDVYAVTQGPGYTTLWFVVPRFDSFHVSSRTYLIAQNGSQSIKLKIKEMGEWTKDKEYVKFKLDVDHGEDYVTDRLIGLIFDEIDPSIATITVKDEKRNWAWTGIHLNPSE